MDSRSLTTFAGSAYISYGLVALASSSYLNSVASLSTDLFVKLWAETILALVLGFVLLIAALLVSSEMTSRRWIGGVAGVLASLIGVINTLVLLTTTVGLNQGGFVNGYSAQLGVVSELLILGAIVNLFVGFPLGMAGSFDGLKGTKLEQSAA